MKETCKMVLAACLITLGCAPRIEAAENQATEAENMPLSVSSWTGKRGPHWKDFDRLVSEQKFEEASKIASKVLEDARARGDGEEQTRALVTLTVLRLGLHGYETAVRFLKEQPWPDDLLSRVALNLYFAEALRTYARVYSWEINRRERVESRAEVDLKSWTMDQIHAAAVRAASEVWALREQLGQYRVSVLSEYLEPNNYPKQVRPTLRDVVTYMLASWLADSQGWTPAQSAEVYKVDLEQALSDARPADISPTEASIHPLARAVAVLSDLEAWHASRAEPEAALEARLERLDILYAQRTEASDRLRIRKDLESRLPSFRKHPWWAYGMARLARMVQDEDAPDALVRARQIAADGLAAYRDSVGGNACLSVVRSIEQQEYSVEAMLADGPGKRSIKVTYRNLRKLYFRAYSMDFKAWVAKSNDWSIFPSWEEVQKSGAKLAAEWAVDLPETTDFRNHVAYVTPKLERPGFYVVVASGRPDFSYYDNSMQGFPMTIGDLVITSRADAGFEVRVLSGQTGRPVEGAEVHLYRYDWRSRHREVELARTGRDGFVRFDKVKQGESHFLLVTRGDDLAVEPDWLTAWRRERDSKETGTFLFLDRSIYRPLQKVFWKAVLYEGSSAQWRTAPATELVITLHDANGQEVERRTVKTNRFGTASGEFLVPAGRMLGRWSLRSSANGYAEFLVEEYKRPTFEVKILDPTLPFRLNREAVVKGEARYYFGLPVSDAQARFRVTREAVYPWWWYWWWGTPPAVRTEVVATGAVRVAQDGTFTFKFMPQADERLGTPGKDSGITYRYNVTVDVTDEGGETRTADRQFRVGFTAVEAHVDLGAGFVVEGQGHQVTITRTDLNGTPVPGKGRYKIVRLRQPSETLLPADQPIEVGPGQGLRTPGDLMRPRFDPKYVPEAVMRLWPDGEEQVSGELAHDETGAGIVKLPPLDAGPWRLRYQTEDAFGTLYETSLEFVCAGKDLSLALPLLLRLEQTTVKVGGVARVLVVSGLKDQPIELGLWKDGKLVERRDLWSGRDPVVVELPVREEDRGGFGISVLAVRDHQFMRQTASVFVPWDNRELSISFITFRDKLIPGGKEKWTVKVSGPAGRDSAITAAELLAYMYDRSLDLFAPHNPPSPKSLYPHRTGVGSVQTNLKLARRIWVNAEGFNRPPHWPDLVVDRLKFEPSYGIGGPGVRGRYPRVAKRAGMVESLAAPASRVARMEAGAGMAMDGDGAPGEKVLEEAAAPPGGGKPQGAEVQLRTNFAETAFFFPHLLTGPDGTASIEFTVPDSVTSWNVWVHAITNAMEGGSLRKEARSVKELMVRPYLPRFFREGDQAELKVTVNNASAQDLSGKLTFEIFDPESGRSLGADFGLSPSDSGYRAFSVAPGGSTTLAFPVKVPARVGTVAVKVMAVSGQLGDGEQRPIPVLPGRMHLAQSRFVTLKGKQVRQMRFADLARNDDPTLINEQMVVTVDGQLFYSVLSAVPYLVNYPYECTEQTLNRFVSTGILTALFDKYPSVKRMAAEFSKRKTRFEQFDAPDPNRKMAMEETPWLMEARGGETEGLVAVLNPEVAAANRESALAKLRKSQTSSGGFPWFSGGPPSPYMTLYVVYSFSKAMEFGVPVPEDMVRRAWAYLHRHYLEDIVQYAISMDCCFHLVTFLNYVISNYKDPSWTGFSEDERKAMLDFSFRHWKEHSPYLKGELALTLLRMGRAKEARLVWESVMDSAKEAEDQGVFWAPEDRAWLWYNDTIETHAFAIRVLMELMPDSPKLDGLVLWLFLNKKLNHWKSTRATAEVVYSLAKYLDTVGQMGVREEATVEWGDRRTVFVFEPDKYTGKKNQIVLPGERISPAMDSVITVSKETPGYLFASATWHFSTERMPAEESGDFLSLSRRFYKREAKGSEMRLVPLTDGVQVAVGDQLEVHLSVRAKHPMEYVHLRDPRGAGFEPESVVSRHRWEFGIYWYEEVRDSGTNFFFESLPQGEYTLKYRLRAATAGTFKVAPATVQPMYAPEFNAYSTGAVITVVPGSSMQ